MKISTLLALSVFLIGCQAQVDPAACLHDSQCLLIKEGTNKTTCPGAPTLQSAYVNNFYYKEGSVIDDCQLTPDSAMIFAFKQHDQSFKKHTGTLEVKITTFNPEAHQVVQVLTSSGASQGGGSWEFCGNIEDIPAGLQTKTILCTGKEIGFIKLKNAPWNTKNVYFDRVEAWRK